MELASATIVKPDDQLALSLGDLQMEHVLDRIADGAQDPVVAGAVISALLVASLPWTSRKVRNFVRRSWEHHQLRQTESLINAARQDDELVWRRLLKYPFKRIWKSGPGRFEDGKFVVARKGSHISDDIRTIRLYMQISFMSGAKRSLGIQPVIDTLNNFAGRYMMSSRLQRLMQGSTPKMGWPNQKPEAMVSQIELIEHSGLERPFMVELGDFEMDPVGYGNRKPKTALRELVEQFAFSGGGQRRWRHTPFKIISVFESSWDKDVAGAIDAVGRGKKVYLRCRSPEHATEVTNRLNGSPFLRDVGNGTAHVCLAPNATQYLLES